MSDVRMSDAELLKYAVENGMIDTALVQEKIEMQKREELLNKHPYKIYQGKDGKWYTYLPDKKNGRILKKRTNKKDIEDVVISFWKQEEENPTVDMIFHEWIDSKLTREEISKSTKSSKRTMPLDSTLTSLSSTVTKAQLTPAASIS